MASKKRIKAPLVANTDPRAPLDAAAFLSAAQRTVATLRDDLLARADASPGVARALRAQWLTEKEAKRTGDEWEMWRRRIVVQIAAAWVLSLVFVRVLEDRGLVERNRIAGPGATDSQDQFRALAPYLTDRDYLLTVFRELANLPGAKDLFDPAHNPVWKLGPSIEGARTLLDLFRSPDPETPAFRFGQSDTRFLGDLYQDLDEETRERFALLQTPPFVEAFLLDQTLEPAIREFGLNGTRLIDPTCGSGHFLLGAFERLLDHQLRARPGTDVREAAKNALDAVSGVDINPYAVAIARFRLTLAFLEKGAFARIDVAPELPLHVAVADSLLHGSGSTGQAGFGERTETAAREWLGPTYDFVDEAAAKDVLSKRYAVVVGNPPYVRPWDDTLGEAYRRIYRSAFGQYGLAAPFFERFFSLGVPSAFVGQITSNSIATQDFAKRLVEEFIPTRDIVTVIDTSNARIPGHGTPTIVVVARNREPSSPTIKAVIAKTAQHEVAIAGARFWSALPEWLAGPPVETAEVAVVELARAVLSVLPWKLSTDIEARVLALIASHKQFELRDRVADSGRVTHTGEDQLYYLDAGVPGRHGLDPKAYVPLGRGQHVRDWAFATDEVCLFPYDTETAEVRALSESELRFYWPYRTTLRGRTDFGHAIEERVQGGRRLTWYEHTMFFPSRFLCHGGVAFPTLATHNHFADAPVRTAFNSKAPVLYFAPALSDDSRFALLAYLNSSTACFWIKHEFRPRGATDANRNHPDPARMAHELATRRLGGLPVPRFSDKADALLAWCARELTSIASSRAALTDVARLSRSLSTAETAADLDHTLQAPWLEHDRLRQRMVFLQEEIDWIVYVAVGLADEQCASDDIRYLASGRLPRGQREFERSLSMSLIRRKGAALSRAEAEVDTADAPETSQVQDRIGEHRRTALGVRPELAFVETLVYKRLWRDTEDNIPESAYREATNRAAQLTALLARGEHLLRGRLGVGHLARDLMSSREGLIRAILSRLDLSDPSALREVLDDHAVPFLAQYRYTEAGMEVFREWQRTWERQRAEDAAPVDGPLPVGPPDYEPTHFRFPKYWSLRGKLDVPKECFISYPGCEADEDQSPVYGWAGWNHLQRAIALATLYMERKQGEAWSKERLVPMLAGLDELLPWIWQWHPAPTLESGGLKPGQYVADFLAAQSQELGVTVEDLRAWRPLATRGARRVPTEDAALVRPSVTLEEEAVLLVLALLHARPCARVVLARAFALLHAPAVLKRLVPAHLRRRAVHWAQEVKGRKAASGACRAVVDHLLAQGTLTDGGAGGTIGVAAASVALTPQAWWLGEAELALAAADGMTDEIAERLASKLPSSERSELRVSA